MTKILSLNSSQCYKLLGLNEGASINEIKDAYRRLALEYHPDKNISARDGIKFKLIAEAYHTLREKKNVGDKVNYRTENHTTNKNHQYEKDNFLDLLYSYSKIGYRYAVYAKNVHHHYLEYEPILFEYCDKIEKNASILIQRSIEFFRHNRIRTIF